MGFVFSLFISQFGETLISHIPMARPMNRAFAILAVTCLLLVGMPASALAQENCTEEDCATCRTNNFYYVLISVLIIFAVFFYLTNWRRGPKEPEAKNGEEPVQREG
jgi:quinol-cytochrome oxidoreductase complex cytochrome b subunit